MNTYIYHTVNGYIMIDTGYEHSMKNVENSFVGGCSSLIALIFCKFMRSVGNGNHLFPAIDKKYINRFIEITHQNLTELENILQGKILFTPGHTCDSISLKLGDIIFCGDAAMNGIPSLRKITIWIEDKNAFRNSWNILIDEKANWIYPAHENHLDQII